MGSIYDRLCALTSVSGKFKGAGEHVEIVQAGERYFLMGGSQQEGVQAKARCLHVNP